MFGHSEVTVFVEFALDEYVGGFDVFVDDAGVAQIQIAFCELEEEVEGFGLFEESVAIFLFPLWEVSAFTVLLEDVEIFLWLEMLFVGVDDVRWFGYFADDLKFL